MVKRIDAPPGEPALYYVAEQGIHGFTRSQARGKVRKPRAPRARARVTRSEAQTHGETQTRGSET